MSAQDLLALLKGEVSFDQLLERYKGQLELIESSEELLSEVLRRISQIFGFPAKAHVRVFLPQTALSLRRELLNKIDREFVLECQDVYREINFLLCLLRKLAQEEKSLTALYNSAKGLLTYPLFLTDLLELCEEKKTEC